jgi:protein-tyrosine phosphatase
MIEAANLNGIRTIIATPHYHDGRYRNKLADYEIVLNDVKERIKSIFPDINLYLGCEIYYSHESIELLENHQLPTMAGSKYILLEFSIGGEYQYIKSGLQRCLYAGFLPILAHVERYKCLLQNIDLVEELINMGVYIQINSNNIVGYARSKEHKFTRKLLKENKAHFIATDAHDMNSRSPLLKKCVKYLSKKYAKSYIDKLLYDNPRKVLNKEYI